MNRESCGKNHQSLLPDAEKPCSHDVAEHRQAATVPLTAASAGPTFRAMTLDVFPATTSIKEVSGEARLGHDGWVSEFEAFQWSTGKGNEGSPHTGGPTSARSGRSGVARGINSTAGSGDPSNTMDTLRAEIKLLHWHKLANEAALKAALLKTKKIKARGGGTSRSVPASATLSMPREERAAWMQQVIEEEQSKPLQVSKDFMRKYEEQEEETEGRLDTEVAAHIRSLRNLREQVKYSRGHVMQLYRLTIDCTRLLLYLEENAHVLRSEQYDFVTGFCSTRPSNGSSNGAGWKVYGIRGGRFECDSGTSAASLKSSDVDNRTGRKLLAPISTDVE